MGTFRFPKCVEVLFGRPAVESDHLLDSRIRDALWEDAMARPSPGAWDRLRRAITDRRPVKNRGMWLLNEPHRDPPKLLPATLSDQQYQRAQRIYDDSRVGMRRQMKEVVCSSVFPSFVILMNL